jgi:hypothetical protein
MTAVASQPMPSVEIGQRTVRMRWSRLSNCDLQLAELHRSDVHKLGYVPRAGPTVHLGTSIGPISVVLSALTASGAMIARARLHSMRRESPKHVRPEISSTRFSIHYVRLLSPYPSKIARRTQRVMKWNRGAGGTSRRSEQLDVDAYLASGIVVAGARSYQYPGDWLKTPKTLQIEKFTKLVWGDRRHLIVPGRSLPDPAQLP